MADRTSPKAGRCTRIRLPSTPRLYPDRLRESNAAQRNKTSATNGTSGGSRLSSVSSVSRPHVKVCCRCNGRRKCRSCVCVKQGRLCTSCLPSRTGGCHNLAVPTCPPVSAASSEAAPFSYASLAPTSQPGPPPAVQAVVSPSGQTVAVPSLPPWDSMFSLRTSTLQHVPKGARNAWADLVSSVFTSINQNPLLLDNWQKLFLLPRCILANPPNCDRLGWGKLQDNNVKERIQNWRRGDILNLWDELVSSVSLNRHCRGIGRKEGNKS